MKTNVKKLALIIATVALLAVAFCFGASAGNDGYGALSYEEYGGEATIVGCASDYEGVMVIPDTLGGCPVTSIDSYAFEYCDGITGIVIPESVTYIDTYAFYYCENLEYIIFNNYGSINSSTVYCCDSLSRVYISTNIDYISSSAVNTYSYNDPAPLTVYYAGSVYDWEDGSMYLEFDNIVYKHKHEYKKTTKKATFSSDGYVKKSCACGMQTSTTIASVKTTTIPYTEYTYNGEVKTPKVTVKDSNGKTLKKGTDYKVVYSSGRKAVGKYNVRIKLMGNYSGEKVLSFKILPGKTSAISTSSKSDSITLKWKAVKGAAGYRVYAYDKSTGDYKKLTTTTAVKYTAKNLKGSTTYKFKVLAYGKKGSTTYWASKFTTVKATTKKAYSLALNKDSISIFPGKSYTLTAKTYPAGVAVKWKSNNTAVAKVNQNGKVTGVGAGSCTITAYFTSGGKTYKDTCVVKVTNPSIKLNTTSASIGIYDALYLKATCNPSGATVTWKSSNTGVAKVSSKGTVVPVKAGSCKITASFSYGGKTYSASCNVTVFNEDPISIVYVDWYCNSVDGIEPEITIKNNTNKFITRMEIDTYYKDWYGDPCYCEIRYSDYRNLIVTSGLSANTEKTFYWDATIYNPYVHRIDIDNIYITFEDGSETVYEYNRYWYDQYYYY